jgi:phosphoribosylformylglycinamidine cyclo-ligase
MRSGGASAPRYRQAGVSLESGEESVRRIRERVRATFGPRVESQIGAFAGFFSYPDPASDRLLVSSMDGVGTKLRVAAMAGSWEGVGYDIVSHCVNDIFVHGARPLFFLDYIGAGSLDPAIVERLIAGMVEACNLAGCALIGGETAEMPGMYAAGELDLVGCIVGDVARSEVIDGRLVAEGDKLIGLPSDGLHTNGYSLARHILFDERGMKPDDPLPGTGDSVARSLLRRHRMYLPLVAPGLRSLPVHAMAHITGGGIPGNLPRVLPAGLRARVDRRAWEVPPIFRAIQRAGTVDESEMLHVFNMGIGFILVVPAGTERAWLQAMTEAGEAPVRLGVIERGDGGVVWEGMAGAAPSD